AAGPNRGAVDECRRLSKPVRSMCKDNSSADTERIPIERRVQGCVQRPDSLPKNRMSVALRHCTRLARHLEALHLGGLKQFIAESMFDALARTCMSRAG